MKINNAGRNIIIQDEKLENEAYPDPGSELGAACEAAAIALSRYREIPDWENLHGDPWTIGFGHTGPEVEPGLHWSDDQAWKQLELDIEEREQIVDELVEYCLNENQFSALVSLVFNIGRENLRTSTLLRKLNAGDVAGAADEFPRWRKSKGRVLPGLVARREDERTLFLTPMAVAA